MNPRYPVVVFFLLLAVGLAPGCRDDEPPPVYEENLGQGGQPLMPTAFSAYDNTVLENSRTELPEIQVPEGREPKQTKETPEAIYVAFKRALAGAYEAPQTLSSIFLVLSIEDQRVCHQDFVTRVYHLLSMIEGFEKLLKEKFPDVLPKIEQKLLKVAVGTSMKYSPGDPPGVLLKIGSPVGSPTQYFVPIIEQDERCLVTFKLGDIDGRLSKLVEAFEALQAQTRADQVTAEQFEQKVAELVTALLKLPFENNPELANVEGRRSAPDPDMGKPGDEVAQAPPRRLRRGPHRQPETSPAAEVVEASGPKGPAERGPTAAEAGAAPAGSSSTVGTLFNAAKSAFRKTVPSGGGEKPADSGSVKKGSDDRQKQKNAESQPDSSGDEPKKSSS